MPSFSLAKYTAVAVEKLEAGRRAERICFGKIFDFRNLELSLILLDSCD